MAAAMSDATKLTAQEQRVADQIIDALRPLSDKQRIAVLWQACVLAGDHALAAKVLKASKP